MPFNKLQKYLFEEITFTQIRKLRTKPSQALLLFSPFRQVLAGTRFSGFNQQLNHILYSVSSHQRWLHGRKHISLPCSASHYSGLPEIIIMCNFSNAALLKSSHFKFRGGNDSLKPQTTECFPLSLTKCTWCSLRNVLMGRCSDYAYLLIWLLQKLLSYIMLLFSFLFYFSVCPSSTSRFTWDTNFAKG